MALEMFAGKTGERLLARAPIAEGSFADLDIQTVAGHSATVRLVDRGGRAVKYPGLTPIFETLDEVSPAIRLHIESELSVGGTILKTAGITLDDILAHRDDESLINDLVARLDPKKQDYARQSLTGFASAPPVCPRIMEGQPLQLILGQHISRQHAFLLGTVEAVTIYNAEGTV